MKNSLSLLLICLSYCQICKAQLSAEVIKNKRFSFLQYEVKLPDSVRLSELKKAIADDIQHKEDNHRYFYNDGTLVYDSLTHEDSVLKDSIMGKVKNTYFIDINKDGRPDIIHCGFDIEADRGCTYIFLNIGGGHYERIFHRIGIPNRVLFDDRGAFADITLYEGLCCEEDLEFIDEFNIDYNRNLVFEEVQKYCMPEALLDREKMVMNKPGKISNDSAKLYIYFSFPVSFLVGKNMSKDSTLIPVGYLHLNKDETVRILAHDCLYGKDYLFVQVDYHNYFDLHSFYKPSKVFGLIEEKYLK